MYFIPSLFVFVPEYCIVFRMCFFLFRNIVFNSEYICFCSGILFFIPREFVFVLIIFFLFRGPSKTRQTPQIMKNRRTKQVLRGTM